MAEKIIWTAILSALAAYTLYRLLSSEEDDIIDTQESDAIFSVANRLEYLYRGKAYVGLRIPDADSGSHQSMGVVFRTKRVAFVVTVRNFSGLAVVLPDGSINCTDYYTRRTSNHRNPLEEANRQAAILESYVHQRGLNLRGRYLRPKAILPNPRLSILNSAALPSDVIPYFKWVQFQPVKRGLLCVIKDFIYPSTTEMDENLHQILDTAPMWDRLQFKSGMHLLGEFVEFIADNDDSPARRIKRSKVSQLKIHESTFLGSKLIGCK